MLKIEELIVDKHTLDGYSVEILKAMLRKTRHTYHEDAGHAWLVVPKQILKKIGIADQISSYSYQYLNNAYLEEDQDATLYMREIFPEGFQSYSYETFRTQYIEEINDGDESNIRNFKRYTP